MDPLRVGIAPDSDDKSKQDVKKQDSQPPRNTCFTLFHHI